MALLEEQWEEVCHYKWAVRLKGPHQAQYLFVCLLPTDQDGRSLSYFFSTMLASCHAPGHDDSGLIL